jgi:putative transposase
MPNHVHLIVTPADRDGLRATFAEAHRRYTSAINARFGWTGHLFQGRYGAVAMDENHLIAAGRYIALNPVAAGLVDHAGDWPWSSAPAHLRGRDDELVRVQPLLSRIPDFAAFVAGEPDAALGATFDRAATIGRPLGAPQWIADLERRLGRPLAPRKRGPKPARPNETGAQRDMF